MASHATQNGWPVYNMNKSHQTHYQIKNQKFLDNKDSAFQQLWIHH